MPRHRLQLTPRDPSYLQSFIVDHSAYSEGFITLVFSTAQQAMAFRQLLVNVQPAPICVNNVCIMQDFANCRPIYEILRSNLSIENQSLISGFINQVIEPDLKLRSNNTLDITQAQKEVLLEAVASVYIDDIFSASNVPNVIAVLLGFAFSNQAINANNYLQEHNIDSAIIASIEALQKITHGEAGMESTLSRMSNDAKLPDIRMQRVIIRKACEERFQQQFSAMPIIDQFFIRLALIFYSIPNFDQDPIHFRQLLSSALKMEVNPNQAIGFVRTIFDDIEMMTNNIIIRLFHPDDRPLDEDFFSRIQSFSLSLQEPEAIKRCIQNLRKNQSEQAIEDPHPLLLALKQNNPDAVVLALQTRPQLLDERLPLRSIPQTPICFATQRCSVAVMKVLIERGANVNIPIMGVVPYTCLSSAINSAEPVKVWLLLLGGAAVNSQTSILSASPAWKPSLFLQSQEASFLQLACNNYNKHNDKAFSREAILLQINYVFFMQSLQQTACPIPQVRNIFDMIYHCQANHYNDFKRNISNLKGLVQTDKSLYQHCNKMLEILVKLPEGKHLEFPNSSQQPENINELTQSLLKQIIERLGQSVDQYPPLLSSLESNNISQAVRRCCTLQDENLALELLKIIFTFNHHHLVIDIHQRAGKSARNAFDIAQDRNSRKLYNALTEFAFEQLEQQCKDLLTQKLPIASKITTPNVIHPNHELLKKFHEILAAVKINVFFTAFNAENYNQALRVLCGNSNISEDARIAALSLMLENKEKLNIDVNHPDNGGKTPLYFAAKKSGRESYNLLVIHGADPTDIVLGKTVAEHLETSFPQTTTSADERKSYQPSASS